MPLEFLERLANNLSVNALWKIIRALNHIKVLEPFVIPDGNIRLIILSAKVSI